ncbi:ABC transporter substrate-binding protein [Brevibacillus sp. FSL K6-0770]|uniref:SgrR family transcriptional regulator n=1 Tax=Brevibacillus sp. FSL K6-0770 TaxID=2954673 RepID=UPI0030FB84F4
MVTVLYFLELRLFFQQEETAKPFPVTIEKLSGLWHCTPRNAKLIVRKLAEMGWIDWQPGLGRGNASVLTFLADADAILLAEGKQRMEQGDVTEAMELLNRFGKPAVKEQFMEWLSAELGYCTPSESNHYQDTLRFPVYRSIVTLDPAQVYYHFDAHLVRQLFNTLVHFDTDSRTIHPSIAHSWEMSADHKEWTFYLKKNVVFHHGRELTAHDVVFSLDRLRSHPEKYEASWMLGDIAQLEAVDARTVRILLQEPNYLFLRMLSTTPTSIVPAEIVLETAGEFGKNPIGTGPFQLVRLDEGICILEAFSGHFQGRPQLDRVEILLFPDLETGILHEPDWTSVMMSHGVATKAEALREAIIRDSRDWCDLETLFSCCNLLVFNQWKTGPQNHPKFRQALDLLIDREQMIAELGGDRVFPAKGFRPFSPQLATWSAERTPRPSAAQIAALLAESGYRGETLRMVMTSYHEPDALWIQARCKDYGIHLEIDVREPFEFANHDLLPEHDCQLFGNVFSHDEISELEMYLQKNYFLPSFDAPLAEAVHRETAALFREADESVRQQKLAHIEALIQENHAVLYLVQKKSQASFHKSVRGVTINPSGWLDFQKVWFHPHASQPVQQ